MTSEAPVILISQEITLATNNTTTSTITTINRELFNIGQVTEEEEEDCNSKNMQNEAAVIRKLDLRDKYDADTDDENNSKKVKKLDKYPPAWAKIYLRNKF